jgi:hypothetical protein
LQSSLPKLPLIFGREGASRSGFTGSHGARGSVPTSQRCGLSSGPVQARLSHRQNMK